MLFSTLMNMTGGKLEMKFGDCEVKKFCIDSRKVTGLNSEVFVAINGDNLDGHDFIKEAYEVAVKEKYNFYSYGDAMLII